MCNCNNNTPSIKDCNFCNSSCNSCDPCNQDHCGCKSVFPAACVQYGGDDFCAIEATQGDSLDKIIHLIDAYICELAEQISLGIAIDNIGEGFEVYKEKQVDGTYVFRTIVNGDATLQDITQEENTITLTPGTHRLELNGSSLSIIVNTASGDRVLATVNLSGVGSDNFVQDTQFNPSTYELYLDMVSSPDHTLDLSPLNNHLESVVYNSGTNELEFSITDGTTFAVDISAILADAQIQSDYTENNTSSPAHILNRNPTKTETIGAGGTYAIVATDNNFVIEIDNGANDVTIDITALGLTDNFFVGFIQNGTGLVTFTGQDILPVGLTNTLIGQGHVAAFEIINSTKYLFGNLNPS